MGKKKLVHYNKGNITLDSNFVIKYKKYLKLEKELKDMEKEVKEELIDIFKNKSVVNKSYEGIIFKYKSSYFSKKFDSASLKEADKDLYDKYLIESYTKDSVSLSLDV